MREWVRAFDKNAYKTKTKFLNRKIHILDGENAKGNFFFELHMHCHTCKHTAENNIIKMKKCNQ